MSDPVADYEKAADGFARVLARCDGRLDRQSPCEEWKAQDVVDHVLAGTEHFTAALGGSVPDGLDDADVKVRYDGLRAALASAAGQPGALDQMVPGMAGGEVPASMMLGIYTSDTLIHTWDLARSMDIDVELDADLLRQSWDRVLPFEAVMRQPGVFGPAVEVDDDAPFQDRAMAFFGRRP